MKNSDFEMLCWKYLIASNDPVYNHIKFTVFMKHFPEFCAVSKRSNVGNIFAIVLLLLLRILCNTVAHSLY